MAMWLFEDGIGESRAIRIQGEGIVEAAIELDETLRVGTVARGRLAGIMIPGRRGLVQLDCGVEALLEPLPGGLTEGQALHVEIVREALPEPGRPKRAKARMTDDASRSGPSLRDRLIAAGHSVVPHPAHGPDRFEDAGWSELLEEAETGEIAFAGGALRMALTPAMTLFDVDGPLPPLALAKAGAAAAGRAIRRLGIGGSIGLDLPTLAAKADRQAVAAALDAELPQPFERTAMNGFGFLQIVRRRERASIPELLQSDPVQAAARALLRRAERSGGMGERTILAHPAVVAAIAARPDWIAALSVRIGATAALRADPGRAISAGDVHSQHP
ncbi:ribonuclease [Allosphingosinicella flava]|uniref:Ribonuclease n=1 Tax=Allosphingosinicella flava TaxID=2771430 RepID=A0A7T2GIG0_9SPHN|nr:ribonuclease [Sphingosinicella flava]QPQ54439.1 ribonuclease [Sphingosinicella flava]